MSREERKRAPITVALFEGGGADTKAIASIDAACFGPPNPQFAEELERPWSRVWVAHHQGRDAPNPIAYLLAWHVADELHILSLATLPEHRRQGAARTLLDAALAYGRAHAVGLVLLEVRQSNEAAISLYRSVGFHATGIRRAYYADTGEDAVEMSLTFDAEAHAPIRADGALGRDDEDR